MTREGCALALAALVVAASVGPAAAQSAATTDRPTVLSEPGVVTVRGSETMLASELGAIAVVGADGEAIGDVEDTILGRDGRIVAVVVGVGGWLGLAEKLVAVPWDRLEVRDVEDGYEIVSSMSLETLEAAPAYSSVGP